MNSCFYFPTKTVVVDDDGDFLDGIKTSLDYDAGKYDFFTDLDQALAVINENGQSGLILSQSYVTDDRISGFDKIMLNKHRFDIVSTVVVDFHMPSMSGIEFCSQIKNPHIRKILLTGMTDDTTAIQAFNGGLIDGYVKKQDSTPLKILRKSIESSKRKYFEKITNVLIGNLFERQPLDNPKPVLCDAEFMKYFDQFIDQNKICEYYLTDDAIGVVCLSRFGDVGILYLYTSDILEDNKGYIENLERHKDLARDIESGCKAICVPLYGNESFEMTDENLEKYGRPLEKVGDSSYVAYVNYPHLKDELGIVSFAEFQSSH
jgi:CheY-like chemotaxis protein